MNTADLIWLYNQNIFFHIREIDVKSQDSVKCENFYHFHTDSQDIKTNSWIKILPHQVFDTWNCFLKND